VVFGVAYAARDEGKEEEEESLCWRSEVHSSRGFPLSTFLCSLLLSLLSPDLAASISLD
jgi:hypothetical protein